MGHVALLRFCLAVLLMQLSEVYVMNMRTLKGIVRYEVTWDEWEMRREASLALPS